MSIDNNVKVIRSAIERISNALTLSR